MQPHDIIRERLRQELERTGLTAVELARRAGVKTSFIYDILNGKSTNPSTIKLAQVAESLGADLAWLAGAAPVSARPPARDMCHIRRLETPGDATPKGMLDISRSWLQTQLHGTPETLRSMEVSDDGMTPTLQRGDLLLVDTSRTLPSPPGIFVLFDGLGAVVRRLEATGSGSSPVIRVSADNPSYGMYEKRAEDLRIIGRVIWFGRGI